MQTYTDSQGREWQLELNVWTMKKVLANSGELLTNLMADNASLFARLYSDPILLADIVWPMIQEQAEARGVTLKEFAMSFTGDSLASARDAVVEATVDFFDSQETREKTRLVITKIKQAAESMRTMAAVELDKINPQELAENYIASVTN